jgi:hypothetical protein
VTQHASIEDIFPDGQWASEEEYLMRCPICGDGSHNHCYVNVRKRLYNCYYCGEGGTLSYLLKQFGGGRNIELDEAPRCVAKHKVEPTDFWSFSELTESCSSTGRQALHYLSQRGIEPYEAALYQLRYAEQGRYKGRVIIPIFDQRRERVICFSARSFTGDVPKYLFPSKGETPATTSESVFGIHWAHEYRNVVLVEGAFDAMSINRKLGAEWCGMALLSKHLCQGQLLKILHLPRQLNFYVMMDADAHDATLKIAHRLAGPNPNVWACQLKQGDPDGATAAEIGSAVENAERV